MLLPDKCGMISGDACVKFTHVMRILKYKVKKENYGVMKAPGWCKYILPFS
jgi:hypothetical protein